MVAALTYLWAFGGSGAGVPVAEAVKWLDTALTANNSDPSEILGMLLYARGAVAYLTLDFATLAARSEEGVRLARELNDDRLAGRCLSMLAQSRAIHRGSCLMERSDHRLAGRGRRLMFSPSDWFSWGRGICFATRARRKPPSTKRSASRSGLETFPGAGLARSVLGWSALLEGRPIDAIRLLDLAGRDAVRGASAVNAVAAEAFSALAHAAAGAMDEAAASVDRLVALKERTGVRRDVFELQARAPVAAAAGDHAAAIAHGRAALPSAGGVAQFRAGAVETCALVELAAGHDVAARGYVDELLSLTLAEGFVLTAPAAGLLDARLRRRSGDGAGAEEAAHAALAAAVELPAWSTVVDASETLGGLAADGGSYEEAARLLGAAAALRDDTSYRLCLSERDADIAKLREALDGVVTVRCHLRRGPSVVHQRSCRLRPAGPRRTQATVGWLGQPHAHRGPDRRTGQDRTDERRDRRAVVRVPRVPSRPTSRGFTPSSASPAVRKPRGAGRPPSTVTSTRGPGSP